MSQHQPRHRAPSVPHGTLSSIRAALAASLSRVPEREAAELFRAARDAARRDGVSPAQLIEIITSTWDELADAARIPPVRRADRLAEVLTQCLEAIAAES